AGTRWRTRAYRPGRGPGTAMGSPAESRQCCQLPGELVVLVAVARHLLALPLDDLRRCTGDEFLIAELGLGAAEQGLHPCQLFLELLALAVQIDDPGQRH